MISTVRSSRGHDFSQRDPELAASIQNRMVSPNMLPAQHTRMSVFPVKRPHMRRMAGKHNDQQAVRGRIGEHEAVGEVAMLAQQFEDLRGYPAPCSD